MREMGMPLSQRGSERSNKFIKNDAERGIMSRELSRKK